MNTRWTAVLATTAAAGLLVGGAVWLRSTHAPAPNVVLVVLCSVRADQTSLYDGPATMPRLAQLANDGVVFDDGVTAAPWTRPSTAALLTGQHPMTLGILEPKPGRNERALIDSAHTLAEHLSNAGYWTVGRTGNPNTAPEYGFAQGFDDYQYLVQPGGWASKTDGQALVDDLLTAVDAHASVPGPGFVFGLFVDAHGPTSASVEDTQLWQTGDTSIEIAGYRAMLSTLDSKLGALFDGLEERGWTQDNTVLMVVNDHGEALSTPDFHGRAHGWTVYPSVTRMLWTATGPTAGTGRVRGLASGVDVTPTVLDLAGIPVPTSTDGQSVAASIASPQTPTTRKQAWTATMFGTTKRVAMVQTDTACLHDFAAFDPDRVPRERQRSGCVDRASNPHWDHPQPNAARQAELTAWWTMMSERMSMVSPQAASPTSSLDEALQALGYVE